MSALPEPDVLKTALPGQEPICRVGLVLEEDNKTAIEMELPLGKFKLTGGKDEKLIKCDAPVKLKIKVNERHVIADDVSGDTLIKSPGLIGIESMDRDEKVGPKSGILLKGVVAGRGFHWQKEVDLFFPHRLEFHHRHGKLIVVNVVPMEIYLACVVTSEMSSKCPPEFIKAQATAARSWMLVFLKNKHLGEPFSICNDDCCQRYQGTTFLNEAVSKSVSATSGMCILTKEGFVCGAYYSKSCGGIMERAQNIFGEGALGLGEAIDAPDKSPTKDFNPITEDNIREWVTGDIVKKIDSFCSPRICPEESLPDYLGAVDEAGHYFRWKVEYTREKMVELMRKKMGLHDASEFLDFSPGSRGNSGRLHELYLLYRKRGGDVAVHTIKTQYQIRNALHDKFLFSSGFIWDYERNAKGRITKIILQGAGWGHGAGLCQIGALGMALEGFSYEDILKHYYSTSSLVQAY